MNKKIVEGIHYKTNAPIQIEIENNKIVKINSIPMSDNLKIVSPGLIDLQINGFRGIDFNKEPLDTKQWEEVTKQLASTGVTTFYPTIITNSHKNILHIFEKNSKVLKNGFQNSNLIGGFHLEGPYISPEDGPRGAHNIDFVRSPNWKEFTDFQVAAGELIRIVTLSPEWPNSNNFIKLAAESGIVVAVGHLDANDYEINEAVKAGAVLSTHLGNGAHVTLSRHPNYLWDQLAEEKLWVSVIADGHHLPVNLLKVFNEVKKDKMILISDAVSMAGMPPGDYETTVGGSITLTEDNKLHLRENPKILAGSAESLLGGVNHLYNSGVTSLENSLDKASVLPAKLMGLPQEKGIEINVPADLILLEQQNDNLIVVETIKNGKTIYSNTESESSV